MYLPPLYRIFLFFFNFQNKYIEIVPNLNYKVISSDKEKNSKI